jgi:hypothetical protein
MRKLTSLPPSCSPGRRMQATSTDPSTGIASFDDSSAWRRRMTHFKLRVGAKLKNGAIILAMLTERDGKRLVLADGSNDDRSQPHYATCHIDDEGNALFCHYFSDLDEAAQDLILR